MGTGKVVSPSTPREESGIYWGYTTRIAASFMDVFEGCPYKSKAGCNGYDLKIGTSERGDICVDNEDASNFDKRGGNKEKCDNRVDDGTHVDCTTNSSTTTPTNDENLNRNANKGKLSLSSLRPFKHAIIVFGGVSGIEECIDADESI